MRIVSFQADNATVKGYLQEDHDRLVRHKVRPALILCAGGAYRWQSPREEDPVALRFSAMGYNVFIVTYSVKEKAAGQRPLRELAQTVKTVRARAGEFRIDPHKVAVMGFSAGGHLACSLAVLWDELGLGEDTRPDALILGYPVITTGAFAHPESIQWVTGGDLQAKKLFSLENHVTGKMPPTFVWHCVGDESVPVENTLLLVDAMQKAGVDYECHLFQGGAHGISMCTVEVETPYPQIAPWVGLCETWLNARFEYTP